jgi:type IV secretory pathway VirJ component
MTSVALAVLLAAAGLAAAGATGAAPAPRQQVVTIRGRDQALRLYGPRDGTPVIVSSGDGGWIHLAPHVAEVLSSSGFFVVGFDVRAYLAGFTTRGSTLRVEDEPADYKVLIDFAAAGSKRRPVLIGVSEGAGLSVLAATDPEVKRSIGGVVGLGLSDHTELGWRWRDAVIYVTHGAPHEPSFSVQTVVDRLTPLPLAAIHSTHDEYAPVDEVQRVLEHARQPKRLWVVRAANHRFSDNLAEFDRTLTEAIEWVSQTRAGGSK